MRGFLIAVAMALALAGCNGSSTHAVSSSPAPAHTGTLKLSRSWSSGGASGATVSKGIDRVVATIRCSRPSSGKVCAAAADFGLRFRPADSRCLGRAHIGVRGVVDGVGVRLNVPIPGCLTGQLRRDAELIDLPYLHRAT